MVGRGRDYYVKQWDRFKGFHWGDLAHSTHLRGGGSWDEVNGERDRVTVTLATGIPEDVTRAIDLDYLDPAEVNPAAWAAGPDTLVVPDAGEDLYRCGEPCAAGPSRRHPANSRTGWPRTPGTTWNSDPASGSSPGSESSRGVVMNSSSRRGATERARSDLPGRHLDHLVQDAGGGVAAHRLG